jgi:peptidyl-tRNA hydrolase
MQHGDAATVCGTSAVACAHAAVKASTGKRKMGKQLRQLRPRWRVEAFKFVPLE